MYIDSCQPAQADMGRYILENLLSSLFTEYSPDICVGVVGDVPLLVLFSKQLPMTW
jgi:hypothetical protein